MARPEICTAPFYVIWDHKVYATAITVRLLSCGVTLFASPACVPLVIPRRILALPLSPPLGWQMKPPLLPPLVPQRCAFK